MLFQLTMQTRNQRSGLTKQGVPMKLHYQSCSIQQHLFDGQFGLEKESLRVNRDPARLAQSVHPFSDPRITVDFAENQTEINTSIHTDIEDARKECEELTIQMEQKLSKNNEMLWPFSNPCRIDSEEQIPMLQSGSKESLDYREYLASRYGKRKMLYCGIHFNFSFTKELLSNEYELYKQEKEAAKKRSEEQPESEEQSSFEEGDLSMMNERDFIDRFYLDLAIKSIWFGWILSTLFNASPIYDGSLFDDLEKGKTNFAGMSSMRNGIMGYWNFFTPLFDFSSMQAYTASIEQYVRHGQLKAPRELYFPVRIKPAGPYSLETLNEGGADHIELRMIDLNPYELSGISKEDAAFCHLFLVYLACMDDFDLDWQSQIYALQNFKSACILPLRHARIIFSISRHTCAKEEAIAFLEKMKAFFEPLASAEQMASIDAQLIKLHNERKSLLACRVRQDFSDFASDGACQARLLQDQAIACRDTFKHPIMESGSPKERRKESAGQPQKLSG